MIKIKPLFNGLSEGELKFQLLTKKGVTLKNAVINPALLSETILTCTVWSRVEIFLKPDNSLKVKEVLFYREQAKGFYDASKDLSLIAVY